jgi:hypothetical protein
VQKKGGQSDHCRSGSFQKNGWTRRRPGNNQRQKQSQQGNGAGRRRFGLFHNKQQQQPQHGHHCPLSVVPFPSFLLVRHLPRLDLLPWTENVLLQKLEVLKPEVGRFARRIHIFMIHNNNNNNVINNNNKQPL